MFTITKDSLARYQVERFHTSLPVVAAIGTVHAMAKEVLGATLPLRTPVNGVVLDSFSSDRHGYLKITVTPQTLRGEYYTVPRPHESWKGKPMLFDSFEVDLANYRVSTLSSGGVAPPPQASLGHAEKSAKGPRSKSKKK